MGQHAEDILDGLVCEGCGEFFDDVINGGEAPGYPRRCAACAPSKRHRPHKKKTGAL